jgi:hypothetical protein
MRYWAKFLRNFFTVLEKKLKGKNRGKTLRSKSA